MGEPEHPRRRDGTSCPPEHSVLSLEEYLAMQRSIGNETRFRVLNALVEAGPQSASELRDRLGVESNVLHYHLDELVDVGLVENRKRKEPDADGLYSYYRATSLGEGVLEHGVRELMRREWDALEEYSDSSH
ncbi:ArsR/SmtB family transcription factor [Halosolutus amylolyticus]|uniref:ArsR/SmtB family transcription factor n=1 Tax=Halosolutus amylolyticus TaxID=2932267 RepID=A0ABD5PU17_9EURY|nr:helix-turn-helix domain-containing protein [Halosolutus amylolyticus]